MISENSIPDHELEPVQTVAITQALSLQRGRGGAAFLSSFTAIPLVLIHGWGSDSKSWQAFVEHLPNNANIFLLDLPGFGLNSNVRIDSVGEMLKQIDDLLPEKCHLLGWSLGGMIATELCLFDAGERQEASGKNEALVPLNPKILSLTAIATNAKFVSDDNWKHACSPEVYENFVQTFSTNSKKCMSRFNQLEAYGDANRQVVIEYLKAKQVIPNTGEKNAWLQALSWLCEIDNTETIKHLGSLPFLSVFGENDPLVPVESSCSIKKINDKAQIKVLPSCSHAPHISQPHKLVGLISEFLSDLSESNKFKKSVAKSFSVAASTYDQLAELQKQVAKELVELYPEKIQGEILDLGCGTGFCSEALLGTGSVTGLDLSFEMAKIFKSNLSSQESMQKKRTQKETVISSVCADFENLPFSTALFNTVVSSMSVQWAEDMDGLASEVGCVLKDDSYFVFSTLGPQTFLELKNAWSKVDDHVHVNDFLDKTEIEASLSKAGFDVVDFKVKDFKRYYSDVFTLMRDIKNIGASNKNNNRIKGLTGRGKFQSMSSYYETLRKEDGLPLSYQVYFVCAKRSVH